MEINVKNNTARQIALDLLHKQQQQRVADALASWQPYFKQYPARAVPQK